MYSPVLTRPNPTAYKLNPVIYLSILVIIVCCQWIREAYERTVTWRGGGEEEFLYVKPYALASYLSLTGVEGVIESRRFQAGAERLALSWLRHVPETTRREYDMVLLVTDPYNMLAAEAASELTKVGWNLVRVEPLYGIPSASLYFNQNRYTHTAQFTKLHLWKLEGYKHILYLDSDMLVVKDVIHVISGYTVSNATLGVARNRDGSDAFNAGLLYITPSKIVFDSMMSVRMTLEYDLFYQEQGFLNVFWKNQTVLMPSTLNQDVGRLTSQCVVMHFVSSLKPWNICPSPVKYTVACKEWASYD